MSEKEEQKNDSEFVHDLARELFIAFNTPGISDAHATAERAYAHARQFEQTRSKTKARRLP